MPLDEKPVKQCKYPDCKNVGKKRGKGLGDRSPWCSYHRMGKGKQARLDFVAKQAEKNKGVK